jgi:hypothetical protein
MARVKLKEGDIFKLPVNNSFCYGLIVRLNTSKIPFGYFYKEVSILEEENKFELSFDNLIYIHQFGIQGFKDGTWQIIGSLKKFKREDWPMPVFYQKTDLLPANLIYLNDNLEEYKRERATLSEDNYKNFPSTGLGGSLFIEKKLAKILELDKNK